MKKSLFILSAFLPTILFAQAERDWTLFPQKSNSDKPLMNQKEKNTHDGYLKMEQDSSLNTLLEKYHHNNSQASRLEGYRIQILSVSGANSKSKARMEQLKFSQNYPNVPNYLKYQTPNFQVRIGDFRTKLEAEKQLEKIKDSYPYAFIKKDVIELPAIDQHITEAVETE